MTNVSSYCLVAVSSAVVAVALPSPVAAQAVPSSPPEQDAPGAAEQDPSAGVGDIVVTAQRRSENMQNVPVAISAATGEQLVRVGLKDVGDLRLAIPTLNITSNSTYLLTSLRGIGSNGLGPGVENPIALYLDGVYFAAPPGRGLLALPNIAQVEVLKGPQGTLFGRNASGGLIQVTTLDPTPQPSGKINFSYANYQRVSGAAYLAGGLTDTLRVDIAVQAAHQGDGWGKNLVSGQDVYQLKHDLSARSKWIFEPTDLTKFTLILDYTDHKDTLAPYHALAGTIAGLQPLAGAVPDTGYDTATSTPNFTEIRGGGASLKWDQSVGALKLSSITAYRQSRFHFALDFDGTPLPAQFVENVQHDRQFSQELQLTSPSHGRLTWVAGLYYYNATSDNAPSIVALDNVGIRQIVRNTQRSLSYAGYLQFSYKIGESTKLTAGGRFTSEQRRTYDSSRATRILASPAAPVPVTLPDRQATFNKATYRFSIDHRFSSAVLAYASVNRGFKSGGFNVGQPGTDPFQPETLDAYEAGLKTDLFNRRLRVNVAGFYYDYKNVQVQHLTTGATAIINGAGARIYGVDADVTAKISRALSLTAGLGLIDPKFTSFPNCPVSTPLGGTPVVNGSCKGNMLPLASRLLINAAVNYTVPIGSGELNANANIYYNSGYALESDNAIRQGRYAQLGTTISYRLPSNISIGIFGKNLTNQRTLSFVSTVPNGTHNGLYGEPRTYGVTLAYSF